jgi:hypothetical protein
MPAMLPPRPLPASLPPVYRDASLWACCSRIARFGSAYFVIARRGKNASGPSSSSAQHGGRAIPDARSILRRPCNGSHYKLSA